MKKLINILCILILGSSLSAQEIYLVAIEAGKYHKIQYVKDTTDVKKIVQMYYKSFELPNTVYCDIKTEKYHIYIERKRKVKNKRRRTKYKKIKV